MWRHFLAQMCKPGYRSIAVSIKNAMIVVTFWLINYSGHSGAKTDLRSQKPKTGFKKRKNIFGVKPMPVSVIVGLDEPEKVGLCPGTKWLLHSVIGDVTGGSEKKTSEAVSPVNNSEMTGEKQIPRLVDKVPNHTLSLGNDNQRTSLVTRSQDRKSYLFWTCRHYQGLVEAVIEATVASVAPQRENDMASTCALPVWT